MPRRPSLLDRFFNDLSDALHDTVEGIIEDAEDVFRAKFQPPAPQPHSTPRPGKRSTGRSRKSARPKAQEGQKTSPGASYVQRETLYGVLGVRDDAPVEVIQGAWKALCRIHHPDAGGDGERIKLINAAYETLSDPKKRREYDRELRQFAR